MGILHKNLIPEEYDLVRKDIFRPQGILQTSPACAGDKSSAVNSHVTGGGVTVPGELLSCLSAGTWL